MTDMTGKLILSNRFHHGYEVKGTSIPLVRTGYSSQIQPGALILCVKRVDDTWILIVSGEKILQVMSDFYAPVEPTTRFEGMSFCFTGALKHTRQFYKALVEIHGGVSRTTVTKDLTYLVMPSKEMDTTKAKRAKKYGTACLNEEEFLSRIL